jgi:nuclear protein localization family protein 4
MLLRFRGRDGQFNLTVEPSDDFYELQASIADRLPKDTDLSTLSVSNKPHGGDARKLAELRGIKLAQVGLKYAFAFHRLPKIRTLTLHPDTETCFSSTTKPRGASPTATPPLPAHRTASTAEQLNRPSPRRFCPLHRRPSSSRTHGRL